MLDPRLTEAGTHGPRYVAPPTRYATVRRASGMAKGIPAVSSQTRSGA